jgi:hypothetical protein
LIICHSYRFCFFALPRTGSKAISKCLLENLPCEERSPMHMGYGAFMATATQAEQQYFKFAGIRNPLDSLVSAYFKKKTDHNGRFSRGTFSDGRPIAQRAMEEYRFIVEEEADFPRYFQHFYTEEYTRPKHEETVRQMDALIRFENLQHDFDEVMARLGLPALELPGFNKTAAREADFEQYYPESIRPQAVRVLRRLMTEWDYSFPASWGEYR